MAFGQNRRECAFYIVTRAAKIAFKTGRDQTLDGLAVRRDMDQTRCVLFTQPKAAVTQSHHRFDIQTVRIVSHLLAVHVVGDLGEVGERVGNTADLLAVSVFKLNDLFDSNSVCSELCLDDEWCKLRERKYLPFFTDVHTHDLFIVFTLNVHPAIGDDVNCVGCITFIVKSAAAQTIGSIEHMSISKGRRTQFDIEFLHRITFADCKFAVVYYRTFCLIIIYYFFVICFLCCICTTTHQQCCQQRRTHNFTSHFSSFLVWRIVEKLGYYCVA